MKVLILGGGVMQMPAVRLAKQEGWTVVVAAAEISREIEALADRSERVDLRDREAVVEVARGIAGGDGLDGVFTAGTDFSTTVAWVAEKLGLPGIPYTAALSATDKARMRAAFEAHRVPSPGFFTVEAGNVRDSESLISAPAAGFSYPLVVKPVDNMGARGVCRVDDTLQLKEALETALAQSAVGQAIVEQYLEGPELSLDALVHESEITICGVADRHIYFPPYFVEMGHTMPSELPEETLGQAEEVFRRGIRALGITRGAAKGDIKITPRGAVVGEIAARLSGGYMSGWTYPLASGVEVTSAALNIAVGLPPGDLKPRRNWVSAERAFISIPGRVERLEGLREARNIPGVEELFLRVSAGWQVELPINNMGKCGNVISAAPDRSQAVDVAERAVRSLLIRLKPADPGTDAFLQGKHQAGFSAFSDISASFRRSLQRMPPWIGDPGGFSGRAEDLRILELREAVRETSRDWHGWGLEEAFRRVLKICGITPVGRTPEGRTPEGRTPVGRTPTDRIPEGLAKAPFTLGRIFWNAMIKGGVQAGVYLIDSLCAPKSEPKYIVRNWPA